MPSYFGGFNEETESRYNSNSMDELKLEIWYKGNVRKLNGPMMISFAKRNTGNPPHNEILRDRIKWCDVWDSTPDQGSLSYWSLGKRVGEILRNKIPAGYTTFISEYWARLENVIH